MKIFKKILETIEDSHTTFSFWLISFLCLIVLRVLIENWLTSFKNLSGIFLFYEFTHTLLFFLITYILFLWFLKKMLGSSFSRISNVLLLGFLVILTPPLLDKIIYAGRGVWSFYDFGGVLNLIAYFFSFFDDTPDMGITYGVKIEIIMAMIFIFIYSFLKTRSLVKSASSSFITYVIFFFLGTFPSWIAIAVKGFSKGFLKVQEADIAQMFITPAKMFSYEIHDIISSLNIKMSLVYSLVLVLMVLFGLYSNHRKKFVAFIRNARLAQLLYHGGLLSIGLGLGLIFNNRVLEINFFNVISFLVLLVSISFAWLASVIVNDLMDRKIDRKTNAERPLIREILSENEYKKIGLILFATSILFSAIVNFKIAFLLIAYQALAWIYSAWPFRLKRFAFVSTFTSSIASVIILFSGYIIASPIQDIRGIPFNIILLLIAGYTLSLSIKDFKDVEGDRDDKIYTIPVIFGKEWGKIITGSGIFISYLLSVVLLNEFRLFWWAILFGGTSFWTVMDMQSPDKKTRIHYNNITWWIMGLVFLYGIILVKVAFL